MREDGSSRFPFQPNSPVDPRFFVGRKELVEKVTRYSAGAFSRRNIRIVYLSGYRGIGKTSLARYCRRVIEQRMDSWGFHVYLGGIQSGPKKLEDFLVKTIRGILEAKSNEALPMKKIKEIFSHWILEIKVGVVTIKQKELAESAPKDASQLVTFFTEFGSRLYNRKQQGFVLVFDELDGVALEPFFADFLKELLDSYRAVPLIILLCGTRDRFDAIKRNNSRAAQQMDLLELGLLKDREVEEFVYNAFNVAAQSVTAKGMDILIHFSGGHPHVMHLIGETALLTAERDKPIGEKEAYECANVASDEWGHKFVGAKLMSLFQDSRHENVLRELCRPNVDAVFSRSDLLKAIGVDEDRHVDQLLQRLHEYEVLERGRTRGEWRFSNPLTSLYMHRTWASFRSGLKRG